MQAASSVLSGRTKPVSLFGMQPQCAALPPQPRVPPHPGARPRLTGLLLRPHTHLAQAYKGPEEWVRWARYSGTSANGTGFGVETPGAWAGDVTDFYRCAPRMGVQASACHVTACSTSQASCKACLITELGFLLT
jgi:hypothetical protein